MSGAAGMMNEKRKGLPVREEEREAIKLALQEALREWLEEKYAAFGKWSVHGLMAAGLAALVWLILTSSGWHRGL